MFQNPHRSPYRLPDRDLIGRRHAATVRELLSSCPAHRPTELRSLPRLAAEAGLAGVHLKAEWDRMGLSSFKALGGAYAVALLVKARAEASLGRPVGPEELQSPAVRSTARGMTVVCASAGNHGLSVAAGARVFGADAVVFLNEAVPEAFAVRLRDRGAVVKRGGATYEESVTLATAEAERRGWDLVSDVAGPDDWKTPLEVMRGYTVLFEEAADSLELDGGPASHVFIQAGVGGLAAAAAGYLRDRWGEGFQLVVVEPEGAACVTESVRQGRPVRLVGGGSALGRLDCKQPSHLAFELLSRLADAFILVSDAEAERAAAGLGDEGAPVSACGAAGAAGLFAACRDGGVRTRLGLAARSRVLLIGSEAAGPPDGQT